MNVLVIGCGSIGSRHAINIHELGHSVSICEPNVACVSKIADLIPLQKVYDNCDEAICTEKFDASIIASPTITHHSLALKLIEAQIPLFVEKPLSSNLQEAYEISQALISKPVTFMMGHTYRFRKNWQELKTLVASQILGKVLSAEMSGGWYLPDWHFREDYRCEYAANSSMGGGALLTSMSHLYDIVNWLFGSIEHQIGMTTRLSDLEIDVDDCVSIILQTKSRCIVTIYEDFLSRFPRRTVRVTCVHGFIEADFNQNKLTIWDERKSRFLPNELDPPYANDTLRILEDGISYSLPSSSPFKSSNLNDPYLDIIRHFLGLVQAKSLSHDVGIDCGVSVMEQIDKLSASLMW